MHDVETAFQFLLCQIKLNYSANHQDAFTSNFG